MQGIQGLWSLILISYAPAARTKRINSSPYVFFVLNKRLFLTRTSRNRKGLTCNFIGPTTFLAIPVGMPFLPRPGFIVLPPIRSELSPLRKKYLAKNAQDLGRKGLNHPCILPILLNKQNMPLLSSTSHLISDEKRIIITWKRLFFAGELCIKRHHHFPRPSSLAS